MDQESTSEERERDGASTEGRADDDAAAAAAAARHQRERDAFGGAIQWEAAFFGWLAAIGLSALLIATVVGAGLAVGVTDVDAPAAEQTGALGLGGGVVIVLILAIAYLAGGYVAARMARFDGLRQGLGVWVLGVAAAAALALTALVAGPEYNALGTLELPRIPVEEGSVETGGAIALVVVALVALAAALTGGRAGERYHRAVDEAGLEPGAPE